MSNSVEVVFMRHGESEWNNENRFCGWVDVDLSDVGIKEAHRAGQSIRDGGYKFDVVFTSVLKRAFHTTTIIMQEVYGEDRSEWPPIEKHWKMSERHYGALTGKNKAQMVEQYGKDQVQIWRRSYDVRPPPMEEDHVCYKRITSNQIFDEVPAEDFPKCESLKDMVHRTVPVWLEVVGPQIRANKRVLIVAHGTSLRGIIKHVKNLDDIVINELNLPNGIPFVMDIDKETLRSTNDEMRFMADEETVRKATEKVANIPNK